MWINYLYCNCDVSAERWVCNCALLTHSGSQQYFATLFLFALSLWQCYLSFWLCLLPLPPAGKSKLLYLPWWISESVIGGGVYLRELWARAYPGLVWPRLMNPSLLILARSLCNQLSLDALVLDSLSSAQSLILNAFDLHFILNPVAAPELFFCRAVGFLPAISWSLTERVIQIIGQYVSVILSYLTSPLCKLS